MSYWGSLWVNPVCDFMCFLKLDVCFFSQVREFFSYYVFKYVLCLLLSLFSFWDPYNVNASTLDVSKVSKIVLISFHSFFFCFASLISTTLSSSSLIHSSVSFSLLLIPSSVFCILVIVFLISV